MKVSPWWLALGAFICLGLGWRARELFGPAIIERVHHEHVETSGVDEILVRYEFRGADCKVRRR